MFIRLTENLTVFVIGDRKCFPLLALVLELVFVQQGHHIVGKTWDDGLRVELSVGGPQEGRQPVVLGLVVHLREVVAGRVLARFVVAGLQAEPVVQGSGCQLAAEIFNSQVTVVIFLLVSESALDDVESVVELLQSALILEVCCVLKQDLRDDGSDSCRRNYCCCESCDEEDTDQRLLFTPRSKRTGSRT